MCSSNRGCLTDFREERKQKNERKCYEISANRAEMAPQGYAREK